LFFSIMTQETSRRASLSAAMTSYECTLTAEAGGRQRGIVPQINRKRRQVQVVPVLEWTGNPVSEIPRLRTDGITLHSAQVAGAFCPAVEKHPTMQAG